MLGSSEHGQEVEVGLDIIQQELLQQLTNVGFHSSVANDNKTARNLGTLLLLLSL